MQSRGIEHDLDVKKTKMILLPNIVFKTDWEFIKSVWKEKLWF